MKMQKTYGFILCKPLFCEYATIPLLARSVFPSLLSYMVSPTATALPLNAASMLSARLLRREPLLSSKYESTVFE